MRGGVHRYAAQASTKIDAARAEKDPFRMETKLVTSYIGQGMPRFVLSSNPELPNPAFAQIVVQTEGPAARNALKKKLKQRERREVERGDIVAHHYYKRGFGYLS